MDSFSLSLVHELKILLFHCACIRTSNTEDERTQGKNRMRRHISDRPVAAQLCRDPPDGRRAAIGHSPRKTIFILQGFIIFLCFVCTPFMKMVPRARIQKYYKRIQEGPAVRETALHTEKVSPKGKSDQNIQKRSSGWPKRSYEKWRPHTSTSARGHPTLSAPGGSSSTRRG